MPSLGGPIDVAAHLGLRGVGAFAVYAQRPKNVTAEAESDTVRGHAILGASTHRFSAKRTRACRDDSHDKPASSIATYRDTVFGRHLRGY
jgi:hypothetical protein